MTHAQAHAATAQLVFAGFAVEVVLHLDRPAEDGYDVVARMFNPDGKATLLLHLQTTEDVKEVAAVVQLATAWQAE